MKQTIFFKRFLLFLLLLSPVLMFGQGKSEMNIATYNLRLNIPSDGVNAWPNRKEWVKDLIQYHSFDIFGVQEALYDQMMDLDSLPGFDYVGAGRDDGKHGGEYSAIFYNTKKFSVIKTGTFWLSSTPEKPSKGWDAAYPRVCTWAYFKEISSGKSFYMFNTHFDHISEKARENSAKLILEKIQELVPGNVPVVITGDFNSDPETKAYGTITERFTDAKLVSKTKAYGPDGTFNGFKYNEQVKERIDFVFVNNLFEVLKYGVLTDSQELRFPSDHFPVVCKLSF